MSEKSNAIPRPAFIVGVTGHMKFDAATETALRTKLISFFEWLRTDKAVDKFHSQMKGLGLSTETPVIVLTCMAPGADKLMADVAKVNPNTRVHAVLPLEPAAYAEASTYNLTKEAAEKLSPEERAARETEMAQAKAAMLATAEDSHMVMLAEHEQSLAELSAEQRAQWLLDKHMAIATGTTSGLRAERHRCYQAAGERVACYSHILIAICDETRDDPDSGTDPGAKRILNIQLRGLTPGLSSGSGAVSFADTGPVFWLNAKDPRSGFKFLDPLDAVDAAGQRTPQDELNHEGEEKMRAIARAIDRYNKESWPKDTEPRALDEARKALEEGTSEKCDKRKLGSASPIKGAPELWKVLDRTAKARRVAAKLAEAYGTRVGRLIKALHWAAFFSILFLSLYEFWVPASWGCDHCDTPEHAPWWVLAFFWAPFCILVLALLTYLWFVVKKHWQERNDDYRALSEGLRVQFYWTLAGTGRSVASYYLLRQRDALSWLRYAIRSVSFPYKLAFNAFNLASDAQRLDMLTRVRWSWFEEQRCYFDKKVRRLSADHDRLHQRSHILLLTGGFLLLVQYMWHTLHLGDHLSGWARRYDLWLMASVCVLFWWTVVNEGNRARTVSGKNSDTHEHHGLGAILLAFSSRMVRALLLAALLGWCCTLLGSSAFDMPEVYHLLVIVRTVCLVAGGLTHLYIGALFMHEDIRRYDAMRSLFRSAGERLDRHLSAMSVAISSKDPASFNTHLAHAQDLVFGVGREAIHENTEWLTNHRDRPIEPVVAS